MVLYDLTLLVILLNKPPGPDRGVAPQNVKIGKLDSEPIFELSSHVPSGT